MALRAQSIGTNHLTGMVLAELEVGTGWGQSAVRIMVSCCVVDSPRTSSTSLRDHVGAPRVRALLSSALESTDLDLRWVHIHAPGGFGKTTLLAAVRSAFAERVTMVDASAKPGGVESVTSLALEWARDARPNSILVLDAASMRGSQPSEMREVAEVAGGRSLRILTASRTSPPSGLLLDPELGAVFRAAPLPLLDGDDALRLLGRFDIPEDARVALAAAAGGHPLSLVVAAREWQSWHARGEAPPSPSLHLPELTPAKLRGAERLLASVALVPVAHDAMLLTLPLVHESLEERLASFSFVSRLPAGFSVHPLYRRPLLDLLWVNAPDVVAEMRAKILRWYAGVIERGGTYRKRLHYALDWPELLRGQSVDLESFDEAGAGEVRWRWVDEPGELAEQVGDAIRIFEAPETAAWLVRRMNENWVRVLAGVGPAGGVSAVLYWIDGADLALSQSSRSALAKEDPLLDAIVRSGALDGSLILRSWFSLASGQAASVATAAAVSRSAVEAFARPRIERYLIAVREPGVETEWVKNGYLQSFPTLATARSGDEVRVVGYDFRARGVGDWIRAAARLPVPRDGIEAAPPESEVPPPRLTLAELRDALRVVRDDARLAESQLAARVSECRRGVTSAGAVQATAQRASETREFLRASCESLGDVGRELPARELLLRSYFGPALKQRALADQFGLSYWTYRRRMDEALENLRLRVEAGLASS